MNQDEIFSVLKALLVEKNYLAKKDAEAGTWTTAAQASWESYAYHVLGQSSHTLIPNSKEALTRLGITVPENTEPVVPETKPVKIEIPVSAPGKSEPKTLSRVINHDVD